MPKSLPEGLGDLQNLGFLYGFIGFQAVLGGFGLGCFQRPARTEAPGSGNVLKEISEPAGCDEVGLCFGVLASCRKGPVDFLPFGFFVHWDFWC